MFQKLNIFADLGNLIDRKVQEALVAKTQLVVRSGLVELDKHAPNVTDLVAGRKITVHTKTEIWLEENPEDTK